MPSAHLRKSCTLLLIPALCLSTHAEACTGITLRSADGGVVVSRTVEWALNERKRIDLTMVQEHMIDVDAGNATTTRM